jgi:hypothetical protein
VVDLNLRRQTADQREQPRAEGVVVPEAAEQGGVFAFGAHGPFVDGAPARGQPRQVPALTVDVGRRVWWPSALARRS